MPTDQDAERDLIERRIADAGLRPYQAMVIRNVYAGENVTAALEFIERLKEVSGDR